jgi:hypothetical protein
MAKYVCNGAKLKCSMGSKESGFGVIPAGRCPVYIEGNLMGTIMDKKPFLNIRSFGLCQSLTNPAVATATTAANGVLQKMPCVPNTATPWIGGKMNVQISREPTLLDNCKLMCMWMGMIEITNPGQDFVKEGAKSLNSKVNPIKSEKDGEEAKELTVKEKERICAVPGCGKRIIKIMLMMSLLAAVVRANTNITPLLPKEQSWKSGATTVTLSEGTLTISGKGAMEDYEYHTPHSSSGYEYNDKPPPWYWGEGRYFVSAITGAILGVVPTITNVVIEEGVTYIGEMAFVRLHGLKSVTIPSSVTIIGRSAFFECVGLMSVTIPTGVADIGKSAFYGCIGLTSVTIPKSVTNIGARAFKECSSLTMVIIPEGVTNIEDEVFSNCTNLASVTIEDGVKHIGDRMFFNCRSLTTVAIPNSIAEIKHEAFMYCTDLKYVTIGGGVTTIRDNAFDGCVNLTSITIPNTVTTIGSEAFRRCISLTTITIPSSVTEIGTLAFDGCTNLTSIIIWNHEPPDVGYHPFVVARDKGAIYDGTFIKTVDTDVFGDIKGNNACLYVPTISIDTYRAADVWNKFGCIKPIESIKSAVSNKKVENTKGISKFAMNSTLIVLILSATLFIIIKKSRRQPNRRG